MFMASVSDPIRFLVSSCRDEREVSVTGASSLDNGVRDGPRAPNWLGTLLEARAVRHGLVSLIDTDGKRLAQRNIRRLAIGPADSASGGDPDALAGYGAITMKNALANTMSTLPGRWRGR